MKRFTPWFRIALLPLVLAGCATGSMPETRIPIEACVGDDPLYVAYNECQADKAYDQFHLMQQRETGAHY